jgi:hypothetical protein
MDVNADIGSARTLGELEALKAGQGPDANSRRAVGAPTAGNAMAAGGRWEKTS